MFRSFLRNVKTRSGFGGKRRATKQPKKNNYRPFLEELFRHWISDSKSV